MARGRIRSPGCATLMAMLAAASIATTVAATSARAAPPSESPTRAVCPGTFQVLHDDRVGSLRVSAGAYQITVASPARIPCATAAKNLSEFLRDFDGKIRRPWMIDVAQSTFQRGSDAAAAFQLARTGRPVGGGGTANPTSGSCPGFFRVRHDDHVGTLSLLKGAYRISLLDRKALSCAAAAHRLTTFLQDFDGRITRPWMLDNASATFMRGKGSTTGFRVKRAVGPEPKPSSGRRYPAEGSPASVPAASGCGTATGSTNCSFPPAPTSPLRSREAA